MAPITAKSLTESLILLLPEREKDDEGGWKETWHRGPRIWAAVWPLVDKQERPRYRVILRTGLDLPYQIIFLWNLRYGPKRLRAITHPRLIENNRFFSLTVVEEKHA